MGVLNDTTDDEYIDGEGDREFPSMTRIVSIEDLTPQPPRFWWAIVTYCTWLSPHPLEVGAWMHCICTVQKWSKREGRKLHMISRRPNGQRVLLVHPDLSAEAAELSDEINDIFTGAGSYCGGYDILYAEQQVDTCRVFAKRVWPLLTVDDRLDVLEEAEILACYGLDASAALESADVLDQVDGASQLYSVAMAGIRYSRARNPP